MNSKVISCGVIAYFDDNGSREYLLIKHKGSGHWSFPKGHKEKGESDIETARRELMEETGINDVDMDETTVLVEKYSIESNGQIIDKKVRFYPGKVNAKEVSLQEDEIEDYRWQKYEDAIKTLTHKETRDILKQLKNY